MPMPARRQAPPDLALPVRFAASRRAGSWLPRGVLERRGNTHPLRLAQIAATWQADSRIKQALVDRASVAVAAFIQRLQVHRLPDGAALDVVSAERRHEALPIQC